MGILFSVSQSVDDIIYDICCTRKFEFYQHKFEELKPSRYVYVEDDILIISATVFGSHSIETLIPNWYSPDIEEYIYTYLDNAYSRYSKGGKIDYISNSDIEMEEL
jgi:hypothetical protein